MKLSAILLLSLAFLIAGCDGKKRLENEKSIQNNLRLIASAAGSYILEEGVDEVTYLDLVGDYVFLIDPVAGERYDDIEFHVPVSSISVTTADGEVVTLDLMKEEPKIRALSIAE